MQPRENTPFPWYDSHFLATSHPSAVAVVARALCLVDYHQATARELGDSNAWLVYGLASVAQSCDADSLGVLLTGLETLVPPDVRRRWPLRELVDDMVSPPSPPKPPSKVISEAERIINGDGDGGSS
jgi:hypothetical protein